MGGYGASSGLLGGQPMDLVGMDMATAHGYPAISQLFGELLSLLRALMHM
jgi:hypothetical protein